MPASSRGAPPDQFLREKIDANFTKTVELARRTAARPMQTCVASLDALGAAVPTVCPDYAKDAAGSGQGQCLPRKGLADPRRQSRVRCVDGGDEQIDFEIRED